MKRITAIIISAMMLLSLSACNTGEASPHTVDTVNMTYVKSPLNVPSIVEKEKNLFEEAYKKMDLGFSWVELTSGADQTAALASGDLQILNAVGGTSVILSAANGADIRIIGLYSTSPGAFRLFSADDSIVSPEDLRGKTIAGPKGTNLHELLVSYLATGGMTIEDVEFISMDIPSALAALESGSVDCALQAGASAYNCAAEGYHLVTDGEGLIAGTILTATTDAFCKSDPDIIEAFQEVHQDVLSYIENNHDEAIAMSAEATGLTTEAVEELYPLYSFRTELTDEDMAALQATADFMLESGLIDEPVDVSTLLLEQK